MHFFMNSIIILWNFNFLNNRVGIFHLKKVQTRAIHRDRKITVQFHTCCTKLTNKSVGQNGIIAAHRVEAC